MNTPDPPEWRNPPQLAEWLVVSEKTLAFWRGADTGPPYYRVGRHIRYRTVDVEAWLAAQQVGR